MITPWMKLGAIGDKTLWFSKTGFHRLYGLTDGNDPDDKTPGYTEVTECLSVSKILKGVCSKCSSEEDIHIAPIIGIGDQTPLILCGSCFSKKLSVCKVCHDWWPKKKIKDGYCPACKVFEKKKEE